jgi:5'-3' exonuclease
VIARLHVVDGTWELFRAHYSKRPGHLAPPVGKAKKGKEMKATVGLASSMLSLFSDQEEQVTHVGIAFDNPIRSFRNDLFDGYKTEEGVEPELLAQFDDAEDAARALGMVVWRMDKWECDDALATAAARWRDKVGQVRILSPDKDLGQCIRGTQVVQVNRLTKRTLDEKGLRELRGIGPDSVPDFLALVGDTADGIPGLDGFGEKGASALLGRWEKLEKVPADPAKWDVPIRGAEKLGATLAAHRKEALLYRKLATLVEDVPLAEKLTDLRWRGVPRDAFEAWCDRLGLNTMRDRPERWEESEAGTRG